METADTPVTPDLIVPFKDGYKFRDKYLPRVTTVLNQINKPQLMTWKIKQVLNVVRQELATFDGKEVRITPAWTDILMARASKEPERIAGEAADIGTRAHAAVFNIIQGLPPIMDPEIEPCIDAFKKWHEQSGIELTVGEVRVASLKHGYAGTLDCIGRKNGKLIMLDWKTSKAIYSEYAYQVAAYCQAWEEMFGEKPQEAIIVRLPKAPAESPKEKWIPFEAKKIKSIPKALKGFLAAKRLYDGQKAEWFN